MSNNPALPDNFSKLREAAAVALAQEIGQILFHVSSDESGRLAETALQLLPESRFKALTTIVIGHENDNITQQLLVTITVLVAQKLGITLTEEQGLTGAASVLALINCEDLRRKGYMEYVWANDIFTETPSHPGFTRLTETGTTLAQRQLLDRYEGGKYVQ